MASLNFIGGEKGGVGKSVVARILAQYFIDQQKPFVGFDTDRSHPSFARFYANYASPVVVDRFEGLDEVVSVFESEPPLPSVIVDMAAQTHEPLSRWVRESDLLALMAEMDIAVHFWHVADAGKDSIDLLQRMLDTYGADVRPIVVKNLGRGSFTALEQSNAWANAQAQGAVCITLGALAEATMRKIDHQNTSFRAAAHARGDASNLGLLERQRVKTWLKKAYEALDTLPL